MKASIKACMSRADELEQLSSSARLDTELLLQDALKKNRAYLYGWPEKTLNELEYQTFQRSFERRLAGEPIAYILGHQSFWSLDLSVSPCTLIPRHDTERLVETALDYCHDQSVILDLGTGTGAVALALASEFPTAEVHAVDRCIQSVELAIENAKKNNISNVSICQSDWFSRVAKTFDIIVSNPPYIESEDPHLNQGDVKFEPRSALASGADGLDDLRLICKQAPLFLFEGGILLVEHGWMQGEAVRNEFLKRGFTDVETACDLNRRERVTLGRWRGDA